MRVIPVLMIVGAGVVALVLIRGRDQPAERVEPRARPPVVNTMPNGAPRPARRSDDYQQGIQGRASERPAADPGCAFGRALWRNSAEVAGQVEALERARRRSRPQNWRPTRRPE